MSMKVIGISMMLVLIGLFIFTKFYRKREINITKLEADFAEALKLYKKEPNEENKKDFEDKAQSFATAVGISENKIPEFIDKTLS